jgi:hypothetical protein
VFVILFEHILKRRLFMMDKSKQKFQITLPNQIAEKLINITEKKGLSKSVIIALAIEELSKKEGNNDK